MAAPKSLCVVDIGYQHYLLPVPDGLKLMELMQKAVSCEWTYGDDGKQFEAGGTPRLSMEMVRPDQVRMSPGAEMTPAPTRSAPKRLTKQPLRLARKGD